MGIQCPSQALSEPLPGPSSSQHQGNAVAGQDPCQAGEVAVPVSILLEDLRIHLPLQGQEQESDRLPPPKASNPHTARIHPQSPPHSNSFPHTQHPPTPL